MSIRSFRANRAAPENLQPAQDYWNYLPDVSPGTLAPNPRGRTNLFDDGWMTGSDYRLASVPAAAPTRPSVRFLLIDTYEGAQSPVSPPAYYEWSREDESRLSQEEQKQAISKLRKQLYSPHMSNIIQRLGSSKSGSSNGGTSLQDDNGKRCAVCLEDFETKQFVTMTPCNHMFHEDCIVPWVKSQGSCPVCRSAIADQNVPHQRSSGSAAASRRGRNPMRI